jgi:hypothetical protein
MTYRMNIPASIQTVDDLRGWTEGELQAIEQEFSGLQVVPLEPVFRAPVRPREGMIIYADGTNYNPGSGEGPYVYINGAFAPLMVQERGLWMPSITFATPGDLAVSYGTRLGEYVRYGDLVSANFTVATTAFTYSTASGELRVTGLPFPVSGVLATRGAMAWGGITKAGYTDVVSTFQTAGTFIAFRASGSGVAVSNVVAADCPSGGTMDLRGSGTYIKA